MIIPCRAIPDATGPTPIQPTMVDIIHGMQMRLVPGTHLTDRLECRCEALPCPMG